ncbi:hypothetical protein [Streptomyces scabiei]|uniref:hypothetical protein n=1 Tax=Streptomyces scabiei TaxID=1930 RepID=UPI0029B917E4|nr:hypothetical protein [Streptomyces scabiei]MDX2800118.1 hypothetical protein [Streptomyces scabiei]MDX3125379.1 hypothetical protein [Streptomyces scabiei]MDX3283592.1 hypothetical protein [Streptomyces scabiei]
MIRTTYRGRAIKVLAARGKPFHRKLVINGRIIHHAWQGDDAQGLDWFRQIIDKIEDAGGAGMVAMLIPGQYTEPHWYEPGAIDVNPRGHATQPGNTCLCSLCVIDDPCGSKGRYAPLAPEACRYCHQFRHDHKHDADPLNHHSYTEPTEAQRRGRQAAVAAFQDDEDPSETSCEAIYPEDVNGYLGRPRCLYFADHRDASNPDFHYDARGFRWPREAKRPIRST